MQQSDTSQNRIQSFSGFPFVIAAGVCVLLSVGVAASSFVRLGQSCEIELDSRVNPNDAPVASLVRLPGIGIGRAKAIEAYRKNFSEKDSNSPVFRNCDDLQRVSGIGPKTAKNISEWLKFE